MTYRVLDNGAERDATPDEIAEIEERIAQAARPTQAQYVDAVQAMLDAKARERNYDGILSACTYATDSIPKFQAEGQACVAWRGAVWDKCYDVLAQVQAGSIAQPSLAELLAMLPTMEWPDEAA